MIKNTLLMVVGLTLGTAPVHMQTPCYGEGCNNIPMYLGPRLGSRVLSVPHHKPIHPDEPVRVDFSDGEPLDNLIPHGSYQTESNRNWSWWEPSTSRRTVGRANRTGTTVGVGIDGAKRVLNMTWRGYTGEDVKQVLKSLPEEDRLRVNVLILDGNRIRHLPVLVFPVEFEYGLQELSLNDNIFNPSFLTVYSRFELSRLSRLKALRMSRCGFSHIELPSLPFLEELDLSYNTLFIVPPSLGRLANLAQVTLRGNRIFYVTDLPLSSLGNLQVIDLGNNSLRGIQGKPLENHRYLSVVKLDMNRLRSLPQLDYERRITLTLANNSLECSCALMEWVGRPNIHLGYDLYERCRDGNTTVTLFDLRFFPEEHQNLCDVTWSTSGLWDALGVWCGRNRDKIRASLQVGVIIIVLSVVVVLMWRARRSKPRTRTGYNILDDQHVSVAIVSGPRIDV